MHFIWNQYFQFNIYTLVLIFAKAQELKHNGIHSVIRNQLFPNAEPRYAGYTCWRAVIDNKDLDIEISSETWCRNGRFGIAPLANDLLYWFACLNASEQDPRISDLKEVFKDYHHPIPSVLEKTSDSQMLWEDILDFEPIDRYALKEFCCWETQGMRLRLI